MRDEGRTQAERTCFNGREERGLLARGAGALAGQSERAEGRTTLLELIHAVDEASLLEEEVVATVSFMLDSGRVRLAPEEMYREEHPQH